MRRVPWLRFVAPLALSLLACQGLKQAETTDDAGASDASTADEPIDGATADDGGPSNDSAPSETGVDAARCGNDCPIEVLAKNIPQATTITVDQNNIYFAAEGNDEPITQCPKTGCGTTPILLGKGYAFGLAVLDGFVYWGDFSNGKIVRCAVGGCAGAPTPIALNQTSARGVVTDGVRIYWSANNDLVGCDPASCTPQVVIAGVGAVLNMAADQAKVFYIAGGKANVCTTPTCTTPLVLGAGTNDISTNSSNAYWVNGAQDLVVRCAFSGCTTPTSLGTSFAPTHPASDGSSLYYRDDISGAIYRCPATGCAGAQATFAAHEQGQPGGNIAFDGQYVYWTTSSEVHRKMKP